MMYKSRVAAALALAELASATHMQVSPRGLHSLPSRTLIFPFSILASSNVGSSRGIAGDASEPRHLRHLGSS